MQTEFAGLHVELPAGWADITADLPPGTPPTLAAEDGVGAIQFSVVRADGPATVGITVENLVELAREFCVANGFGQIAIAPVEGSRSLCAGGSHVLPTEAVGVWYLSDGTHVALITYVSTDPTAAATVGELAVAVEMVRSVTF